METSPMSAAALYLSCPPAQRWVGWRARQRTCAPGGDAQESSTPPPRPQHSRSSASALLVRPPKAAYASPPLATLATVHLRSLIHCVLNLRVEIGRVEPGFRLVLREVVGVGVAQAGRVGRKARLSSQFSWLPTLRFRAKVMLGFAAVLAISAISLGIAYLGFGRVSDAVVSYRTSVTEADLARSIDRELISYRLLVKYYVVTGKEDDAKAAQSVQA